MSKKINITDILDWKKSIDKIVGINDVIYGYFLPDYEKTECNFDTMTGILNNKEHKLYLVNNQLRINDGYESLLPENIQNSYKKWLISKALKEKLK